MMDYEDRSHFGAWCVSSSPLILGLDLTDSEKVDGVWDLITNREAIAVNQASCTCGIEGGGLRCTENFLVELDSISPI